MAMAAEGVGRGSSGERERRFSSSAEARQTFVTAEPKGLRDARDIQFDVPVPCWNGHPDPQAGSGLLGN